MVLDGLEEAARAAVPGRIQGNTRSKVNVVRYADDLVITGVSKGVLEERVIPAVRAFLAERGLEVSDAKTRLVYIDEGFDFLGFHFRKYRGKLLIQPMREKVLAFCRKIRGLVKAHVAAKTADLVVTLNRVLRGWANHYRHVVSKKTFAFVDRAVDAALRWWVRRRHGNRTWKWIRKRYYRRAGDQRWAFYALKERRDGRLQRVDLFKVSHIPIRRHVKIQGAANPYDPTWNAYFHRRKAARLRNRAEDRRHYATLGVAC